MPDRTPAQQVTRSRSRPVPSACSAPGFLFIGGLVVGATLMAIAIILLQR